MDYLTFMKENLSEIVIFAYFWGFEDGTSSDNFMSKFDKMWHFFRQNDQNNIKNDIFAHKTICFLVSYLEILPKSPKTKLK